MVCSLSRNLDRGIPVANHGPVDDNNCEKIGNPNLGKYLRTFRIGHGITGMKYLFSKYPRSTSMPQQVCLFLDWDGTLTQKDTTHLIGLVGSNHQRRQLEDANSVKGLKFEDPWDRLIHAYSDDYRCHQKAYKPEASQRKSIWEEQNWLESLSAIENRSIRRVEESGIFKGVTASQLRQAGEKAVENGSVKLRDGWDSLLTADAEYLLADRDAGKKQISEPAAELSIDIVSISWSTDFIKGALRCASEQASLLPNPPGCDPWFLKRGAKRTGIHANDIDGVDRAEGSKGLMQNNWQPHIRTSRDKLLRMREILLESGRYHCAPPCAIYVGDSTTDLECLLAANIGICMRDNAMDPKQEDLANTLARLNVDAKHVTEFEKIGDGEDNMRQDIFWARDLGEVAKLVTCVLGSL